MAITVALLTSGSSATDDTAYLTDSILPTANRLIIAAAASRVSTSPPEICTLSGTGLTWVEAGTVTGTGASTRRITLFRSMGAAPSSGALTIDFAGNTQIGCAWSVVEFAGIDTSGTNGSGAVVQTATNNVAAATSLTVTLAAFSSADNATYGSFFCGTNEDQTVGTGFSELHDLGTTAEPLRVFTEWLAGNDTTVDESSATSTGRGGVAIEIKAAAAAAVGRAALGAMYPRMQRHSQQSWVVPRFG